MRIIGDIAEIYLSGGNVALADAADASRCAPYQWNEKPNGHGYLYASAKIDGKTVLLHRFIMQASTSEIVDHRDGNTLDCRRGNMRACTRSQNMMNAKSRSGYKGVSKAASRDRWRVDIKANGKRIRLNGFASPEEAARAYDELARANHGEFAKLNFPDVPSTSRMLCGHG
jgi:hypothetical protein